MNQCGFCGKSSKHVKWYWRGEWLYTCDPENGGKDVSTHPKSFYTIEEAVNG